MAMLFGITFDEWPKVIAWATSRFGHPRYMRPVEGLLWCRMKWEQAGSPMPSEKPTNSDVRLFWDAVAGAY